MTSHQEILISKEKIADRISELGQQITKDYQGKELVVVSILKGAFIFTADLIRNIDLPLHCEFMRVSSYGDARTSSGKIQVVLDISEDKVRDKHVIIIEDIVDTGNTCAYLKQYLQKYQPASLKLCSLLLKKEELKHNIEVDYLGFSIESLYVIGYGLDDAGLHRNLPHIGVVKS